MMLPNCRPYLALLFVAVAVASCSKSNPTAPTPTSTTTTTTVPATFSLSGRVTNNTGAGVGGATVAASGLNAGRSTTTAADGSYTLNALTAGTFNVMFNAPYHIGVGQLVMLTGNQTLNQVITFIPVFTRSGKGNTVFDMPRTVTRVRIQGTWDRTQTSNFIVHIGGQFVVNEILRNSITYDGIHLTVGGVTEIVDSNQISWVFTEIRP